MKQSFTDILGNDNIKNLLRLSLINNRLHHAYIFYGLKGCGKKLLANNFAKAILCKNLKTKNKNVYVCDGCISCKSFKQKDPQKDSIEIAVNNPNIVYIHPQKMSQNGLGVEQVRKEIIEEANKPPFDNRYRIFIINNAQLMSVTAQNTLLKTLEDAPNNIIFLLLCQNINALLPTVLSRCININIKPLTNCIINDYLIKNINILPDIAEFVTHFAKGSIGQAKSLVEDEEFINLRLFVLNTICNINDIQLHQVFELARQLEAKKENIQDILDIFILFYRDVLIYIKSGNTNNILQKDILKNIINFAGNSNANDVLNKSHQIEEARKYLKSNSNFSLIMEVLMLNLANF